MEENISAPETQKSKLDSSRLFQQIFLCCSITGTLLLGFALGITLHFSISTFQTQLDDMLKTTALSLADSAMVREAYHQGYCTDEMIHYFDTLVDTADNMDVLTLSDCNLIRLYHVNHALIGEEFVGGDQGDALAGKSYFSDAIGTLGLQHRFLTPVRGTDGSILGFITVSATMTCINSLKKNIFSTYFWIALVLFLALGIISGIISLMVRRMLLGFTPQGLANTYLTQSEMLDSLDEGVVFVDPKGKVQLVNQAAENILGQKRSKLEGAPLDAILRTREETTLLDCTGENLSTSRPNVLANILVRDDQNKKPGLTLILKDKTEAVRKAEQLNGMQHIVTALRANNHEFMNRLQVIAGLLQIGRTQEALDYIGNVASIHSQAIGPIIQNIQNPSVAALLLGKANHAHELEIGLTLLSGSTLPPHSAYLSTNELVTVLGKIYHMGREEKADLILNRQAMASHTFVTGSTGTGKSNAVYHLLDEITKDGRTSFLVVEPAKGEYKNVFGSRADVKVFGTNPRETPLLRINPFAFPQNIHILEHIDRLVEIFNACWPMYAAMPAVLKDAIERSYQKVGWDLRNSESEKGVFPTFFDLLDILPGVIEESHYSKDTQSDYVGALCTRVKSLTNGIYGSVFCAEDALSDAELFDCNVVVDLSRVGSMETKSLLMGILVMKLQEYRMCGSEMNSRLRHVTVLEEAHNLLRKTSAEQSQEGANLQGKSVEMLANAIAEMRTYGEGFIIADQAPGLLDMSVIRNTNTKIILRLPDEEDRKLVGKSAALKEAQIDELSKLPLGVAAVYQNEWPEAVLCKIEAYPMPENAVYHKPSKMPHEINAEFVFGQLAAGKELEPLSISEMEQLKLWLKRHEMMLKPEDGRYLEQVFAGGELDVAKTRKAVFDFFGGISTVVDYCAAAEKSFTPRKEFLEQLQGQYGLKAAAADWVLNSVISMGMSLNPDAKAVDNLRTNFEQQGGRVL